MEKDKNAEEWVSKPKKIKSAAKSIAKTKIKSKKAKKKI